MTLDELKSQLVICTQSKVDIEMEKKKKEKKKKKERGPNADTENEDTQDILSDSKVDRRVLTEGHEEDTVQVPVEFCTFTLPFVRARVTGSFLPFLLVTHSDVAVCVLCGQSFRCSYEREHIQRRKREREGKRGEERKGSFLLTGVSIDC